MLPVHHHRRVEELGYDEKRPAYKRPKKGMPATQAWPIRTAECDELIARMASLRDHEIPIDLGSHEATRALVDVPSPSNWAAYKKREDYSTLPICAWTAALGHQKGTVRCQVLGVEDGSPADRPIATIIAPARTSQRGA